MQADTALPVPIMKLIHYSGFLNVVEFKKPLALTTLLSSYNTDQIGKTQLVVSQNY